MLPSSGWKMATRLLSDARCFKNCSRGVLLVTSSSATTPSDTKKLAVALLETATATPSLSAAQRINAALEVTLESNNKALDLVCMGLQQTAEVVEELEAERDICIHTLKLTEPEGGRVSIRVHCVYLWSFPSKTPSKRLQGDGIVLMGGWRLDDEDG